MSFEGWAGQLNPPERALIIRGACTPAGEKAFDGWRQDLAEKGISDVMVPGDHYVPHLDHENTVDEIVESLRNLCDRTLIIAHSYGGNIAFQVLRKVPEFGKKVSAIVHMASPLKIPTINPFISIPEPAPNTTVPVVGFSGNYDMTVLPQMTGSRIDHSHFRVDCGHNDFVTERNVRQLVLGTLGQEVFGKNIV